MIDKDKEIRLLKLQVKDLKRKKEYVYPLFGQRQFSDMKKEIDELKSKVKSMEKYINSY